jgi:hypothetical protein
MLRKNKIANLAMKIAATAAITPNTIAMMKGEIPIESDGATVRPIPAPSNPPLRPIAGLSNVPPATIRIIAVIVAMAGTM